VAPRVEEPLAEHRVDREVADGEGLAELRSRRDKIAVVVEDHGGAVEDKLVLASNEVDIGERAGCVRSARGEHPLPLGEDAGAVRRRVQRHDKLCAPAPSRPTGPEGLQASSQMVTPTRTPAIRKSRSRFAPGAK